MTTIIQGKQLEQPEVRACGFLIIQGDPIESFLLMQHKDRWDLPKGHVDGNETDMQCALRELNEETGITADEIEIVPDFRFSIQYHVQYKRTDGKKKLKEVVFFLGRLKRSKEIAMTEHVGCEWFPWNPPHQIQANTIDPLLAELETFLDIQT